MGLDMMPGLDINFFADSIFDIITINYQLSVATISMSKGTAG